MKKDRILNPMLIKAIAELGHTELLVIADAGLPIPCGVPVVDLSLTRGIPSFLDALKAVCEELVVEGFILASEMREISPSLYQETLASLREIPPEEVPHEELKRRTASAKAVVRTGETTPFANVILRGGVNF